MVKHLRILIAAILLMAFVVGGASAQDERPVVMASLVELYTIDPAVGFDQAIGSALKQLYDAPFRYVGNPPVVEPWLAESFDVSEDGLTYTINLREDAVFHDGSPVTAEAVVYSAERLLRVGQGAASLYQGVLSPGNTTAVDAYTVEFTLDQPYGAFPDILTWLFVVNPEVVEANLGEDDGQTFLSTNAAGSGPYQVGNWQPGELYELLAVEDYWRGFPNENYPTSVTRLVTREASTRRLAVESGEVDIADWMTVVDTNAMTTMEGFNVAPCCTIQVYDVKMNTVDGPTADPNLRKAIAYAFDYEAAMQIWEGQAQRIYGPLPTALTSVTAPVYERDVELAQEFMDMTEYADGVELEYVYVSGLEESRLTGLVLQDSLADVGIDITITGVPWADAVATFADPTTSPDLFPLYSSTAYSAADNYLWSGFHSSQAGVWTNPGHYTNSEVDALLEQARSETDDTARADLYAQAEALIVEETPNLFLATTPEDKVVGPRITNYDEAYNPVMGSTEDFYFFAVGN